MLDLFEIVIVVLTLKLITQRWKPPLQESLQAIISILLGTGIGFILNPTTDGMIIGMVTSSLSFYGKDLITSFTVLKEDLKDIDIEITCKK
jgi:hypothetical protein